MSKKDVTIIEKRSKLIAFAREFFDIDGFRCLGLPGQESSLTVSRLPARDFYFLTGLALDRLRKYEDRPVIVYIRGPQTFFPRRLLARFFGFG